MLNQDGAFVLVEQSQVDKSKKLRLVHFLLWLNPTSTEIFLMLLILQQPLPSQDQDNLAV